MTGLLWFTGITMSTKISDIGWTWVLLAAAVCFLAVVLVKLWRDW